MQKLSTGRAEEIKRLRSQGNGYKAIAKLLCLSPSTVHKYSKGVRLSKRAKLRLIKNQLNRECWLIRNFAKEKEIKKPRLDEKLATVLGHLFFDGCVSADDGKYRLQYASPSIKAIEKFTKLFSETFKIEPAKVRAIKGKNLTTFTACFYSKKAFDFVKMFSESFSTTRKIGVPKEIKAGSHAVKKAFLKAFWDDEGCIDYRGYLTGSSLSGKMISDLVEMHKSFGIKCCKRFNGPRTVRIIYINKNYSNYFLFSHFVGFGDSIVSAGYNINRYKQNVFREHFEKMTPLKTYPL